MIDDRNRMNGARCICLFGLGVLFQDCYPQLALSLGREPDLLCDNAPHKWGKDFFGKKCVSPTELLKFGENTAIVITTRKYEEIYRQLCKMGLKEIFVACFGGGYDVVPTIKRLNKERLASNQQPFMNPVQGKCTLITGAARGIGRLIAIEMARLGSHIIAHSRSISHTKEIGDICESSGVHFIPVAAELSNLVEVESMLSQLDHLAPEIDIVYNNAAISPPCPSGFWKSSPQDYIASYTVNAVAPIRICQRLIPPMIQRGFGRIINITSSIQKRPAEMAYACSKSALNKFVHDLSPSLHGTGVMITLLDPGWLRTDMGGALAPNPVESVVPGVLLGALLDCDISGNWFDAQEYAGLSIEVAIQKAKFRYSQKCETIP